MRKMVVLLLIVSGTLVLLISLSFLFWNSKSSTILFSEPIYDIFNVREVIQVNESVVYNGIRFSKRDISYSISDECSHNQREDSIEAFNIISGKSMITFIEDNTNPQIEVKCLINKEISEDSLRIIGEGGPTFIVKTGKYDVVLNGSVILYQEERCNTPITTIHEILHVLGFKHSENKKSIMYSISSCNQIIEDEIINVINDKYKDLSIPDLIINQSNISITKNLLDFEVGVYNIGLSNAYDSTVTLLINDKIYRDYILGDFEIGAGKIIRVKNLELPDNSNNLTFIVDEKNLIDEIDETNNKKEYVIS